VRMVIPWKYGFKSIKSIVKIKFVKGEPPTTWSRMAPSEYGFFSNVNPRSRSPTLEPSQGTPPRRNLPPEYADVQRLRRSGRKHVRREDLRRITSREPRGAQSSFE